MWFRSKRLGLLLTIWRVLTRGLVRIVVFGFLYAVGLALIGALGISVLVAAPLSALITGLLCLIWLVNEQSRHQPHTQHLKALDQFMSGVDQVADPVQLASLVVYTLHRSLRPTHLYLWLPAREKRDFYLAAGHGPDPESARLPEAWLQDFFAAHSMANDEGIGLDEDAAYALLADNVEMQRWLSQRQLSLCVPVHAYGRMVGLLTTGSKLDGGEFDARDRWLLQTVLHAAAQAFCFVGLQKEEKRRRSRMDNLTHLYRSAQKAAITDGLTTLNTQAFFKEQMAKRFSEAKRYGVPLTVMMLDIDHFKKFNDTYGHPVGDEVLAKVAQVVKQEARVADTVARYGGEEFALVLPQTDLPGARILAERIRKRIELIEIVDNKGRKLPSVSASIGLAALERGDEAPATLIERADQALYSAKRQGRNQVIEAR